MMKALNLVHTIIYNFVRYLCLISVFTLSGCDKLENHTPESETSKNYIKRTLCLDKEQVIFQWRKGGTSYPDLQEFRLMSLFWANKMMDPSSNTKREIHGRIKSHVAKGTKLKIEEIYLYNHPLCCQDYIILARINGEKIDSKLVDITGIFKDTSPVGFFEKSHDPEISHLCQ